MKTLNDFVDGPETTMAVVKLRYEPGFAAFVADEEFISKICDMLTGGDEGMMNIRYGIFETDWYPVGFGKCIEEAVVDLNIRVSAFISDEGMVNRYYKAYGAVSMTMFSYDSEISGYVINDTLKHREFPSWLRRYSLISEENLETLFKQPKGNFDA